MSPAPDALAHQWRVTHVGRAGRAALAGALLALLGGCAARLAAPAPLPWRIEPVYRVTDSTFANAEAYRALAKRYEEEGRHDEAQQARRRAAQLLKEPPPVGRDAVPPGAAAVNRP